MQPIPPPMTQPMARKMPSNAPRLIEREHVRDVGLGHCQSKFVYFAKTLEPDFATIDFLGFFRVDLSGSMAAPSI